MSLLKEFFTQEHNADNQADTKITVIDGKATLYKRSRSTHWQVRFKLENNKWHC